MAKKYLSTIASAQPVESYFGYISCLIIFQSFERSDKVMNIIISSLRRSPDQHPSASGYSLWFVLFLTFSCLFLYLLSLYFLLLLFFYYYYYYYYSSSCFICNHCHCLHHSLHYIHPIHCQQPMLPLWFHHQFSSIWRLCQIYCNSVMDPGTF